MKYRVPYQAPVPCVPLRMPPNDLRRDVQYRFHHGVVAQSLWVCVPHECAGAYATPYPTCTSYAP